MRVKKLQESDRRGGKEVLSRQGKIFRWTVSILLIIYTSIAIFVTVVTLMDSVKTRSDLLKSFIAIPTSITFEAYKSSGRIAALLDQNTGPSEQLSEELERVAAQIEHGAIELRNLCARYQAPLPPVGQKPALEPLNIAGRAECNEFGWLHIQLNALLPNCRFASPLWITDTITRLLDRLERRNGKLPLLEEALLVIDEHCDIAARQVYDQDNKAWKAVSNALKGRVVADDDQYSLGVCLLSRRSPEAECHIYVLPVQDAGDFFFLRSDQYPFSR